MKETLERSAGAGDLSPGLQLRQHLVGKERTEKMDAGVDANLKPARDVLLEFVWGSVWTRDGLDKRARSLMTLALLVALDRPRELETHLRVALTNGLSRAEIAEALLHAAAYCGVPAGMGALGIANQFFTDLDAAHASSPT